MRHTKKGGRVAVKGGVQHFRLALVHEQAASLLPVHQIHPPLSPLQERDDDPKPQSNKTPRSANRHEQEDACRIQHDLLRQAVEQHDSILMVLPGLLLLGGKLFKERFEARDHLVLDKGADVDIALALVQLQPRASSGGGVVLKVAVREADVRAPVVVAARTRLQLMPQTSAQLWAICVPLSNVSVQHMEARR